jgi:hypothetical protein
MIADTSGIEGVAIIVATSPELAVEDRGCSGSPAPAPVLARALRERGELPFEYVLLDSPPQLGMLSCVAMSTASAGSRELYQ